ncbi:MAG: hypothetical protein U1B78_04475 [Dehalococcoidia bacterium]|nr:hypothetical protein [Dehalococcoidia bacterium]
MLVPKEFVDAALQEHDREALRAVRQRRAAEAQGRRPTPIRTWLRRLACGGDHSGPPQDKAA